MTEPLEVAVYGEQLNIDGFWRGQDELLELWRGPFVGWGEAQIVPGNGRFAWRPRRYAIEDVDGAVVQEAPLEDIPRPRAPHESFKFTVPKPG